jgi:hypothetical protein
VNETVTSIIVAVFPIATLLLGQARQVMRDIARTLDEWRNLKKAIRGEKRDTGPGQDEGQDMT